MNDRIKNRIANFSCEQLIDWICLSCVDIRSTYSQEDAQDMINDVRAALKIRFAEEALMLQQKLEASEALMLAMRDDSLESRSKLELLTAECAALIIYIDGECYTESKRTGVYTCAGINKPASPATDAMVNEIRAEGVELYADELSHLAMKMHELDHPRIRVASVNAESTRAHEFANKLRADADKDGSDD